MTNRFKGYADMNMNVVMARRAGVLALDRRALIRAAGAKVYGDGNLTPRLSRIVKEAKSRGIAVAAFNSSL